MKTETSSFLPVARREGIISKDVDGELLIYDQARDKAHCLNETAAAIWLNCDGRTSASEISESLASKNGGTVNEGLVWLGLEELRRKHLLEEPAAWPATIKGISGMSRREAVRRIGLGAAIALPIVISITAPTPVQAAVSCGKHCDPCSTSADCCGVCSTSTPGCVGPSRCS